MLRLTALELNRIPSQTLIVPVCEDGALHDDATLEALIEKAKSRREFSGKKDQRIVFHDPEEIAAERVLFCGLGPLSGIDLEVLRTFAGKAVRKCIAWNLADAVLSVPSGARLEMASASVIAAVEEGAFLGNHQVETYKQSEHASLRQIYLLADRQTVLRNRRLSPRVEAVCSATLLAREWVNLGPNDKRPRQLADRMATAAREAGLAVEVLEEKQLRAKGFGALLAVAAGSAGRPRLLCLSHQRGAAGNTTVLVGKGVTFDAGGLNLKPTGSIETMKCDMAGAAAVAAALIAAARLDLKMNLVGIVPLVENMPSGEAFRPGDIITAFSGKTVEIGNTDAEGRLILADAMAYAIETYAPDLLIDLATLTGACVVALGEKIAGLFTRDHDLAKALLAAGRETHERCWRLPLPADYQELLKSDFADLNNVGPGRWGGAITAALFLSEFVGPTRWVHVDIAGPAYSKKESAYCPPGGTGFGVRLMVELLRGL
jgi:leucyl aminopeptidase